MPHNRASKLLPIWKLYSRILREAAPSLGTLAAILILVLVGVLLAITAPWPLQFLVDHVLGNKPAPSGAVRMMNLLGLRSRDVAVIALAGAGLLLHLASGVLGVLRARLEVAAGQRSSYRLRVRLFDHYQRLSLRNHYRHAIGDQIYRVNNDTYCVDALVFHGLLPLLGSGVTLVAMFVVLWNLDRSLALLALAVAPFLVICARYYMGPIESESERVSQREAEVLGFVEHVLAALPVVKAFVREDDESRRFREQGNLALRARLRLTTQQLWFEFAVGGVTAVGTALVLAIGGMHVLAGSLSVGQLLVVIAYLAQVYDPLHTISSTLTQVQVAAASGRRVVEVLDMETEVKEAPHTKVLPAVRGHIAFDRVTFNYNPETTVLDGVSFVAPPGSVIGLVGPTGAGKTTIANLVLRFYDPLSGRVFVDGIDLRSVSVASLRRQISVLLQEPILFPVSIAENIRYGRPEASDEEVRAAAMAAHADRFINALPAGYDTPVAEGGASLSGGERQRISLARAFLKDAPILILDEPTSSVDVATEALIMDSLERLMVGRTVIVIAHRLSTIRRADQILFVQDGRVVERGTHWELLKKAGSYARLHRSYVKAVGAEA